MKYISSSKQKGFTLIELLVVIAVIGMLASIVLVSLGPVRAKARDAKRQSDIRQIATAMELELNQQNSTYPALEFTSGRLTTTAIGTSLPVIPSDPGGGSITDCTTATAGEMTAGNYCGIANASPNNNKYCVFAKLSTASKFFVASKTGVKEVAAAPTTLDGCE